MERLAMNEESELQGAKKRIANEILDMTLYDVLNLLGVQMRDNHKDTDYVELRCFDAKGSPYRYKITLTKEEV